MSAITGGDDNIADVQPQFNSLFLAKVTNIKDPDNLGRIKCKPVSADADIKETEWCYHLAPWGSNGSGIFFFPNVDDLVVLAYMFGEVSRPLVLGSVWIGADKAPYPIKDGKNEVASLKTKKGIEIKFDMVDGKEKLTLTTPKGATVKIDDEAESIAVSDKGGNNALKIDIKGGNIELKAKTKLTLSAGDTKLTLQSSGTAELKASQSIKAEAAQIELKAQSALKASGATAEVKAQGQLTLQSSGITNVKGSLVKLN
jgi:uncharacterized protein involved in type VI secretion and phage assembly